MYSFQANGLSGKVSPYPDKSFVMLFFLWVSCTMVTRDNVLWWQSPNRRSSYLWRLSHTHMGWHWEKDCSLLWDAASLPPSAHWNCWPVIDETGSPRVGSVLGGGGYRRVWGGKLCLCTSLCQRLAETRRDQYSVLVASRLTLFVAGKSQGGQTQFASETSRQCLRVVSNVLSGTFRSCVRGMADC